jgi:predicted transcriptional regulator
MKQLTVKEEEIMGIFWKKGALFVKQLMEEFEEPKPHYNTLSTFVRGLEEKEYLGYKAYGNTYQYFPLISEEDYRKKTLKNVVSKYFDNSYTRVVSTLIEEENISIDELQDLIRQIKKQGQ